MLEIVSVPVGLRHVYEGRWGWYSVDKPTFEVLRVYYKRLWKAVPRAAAWLRWINKAPKHRRGPQPFLDPEVFDVATAQDMVSELKSYSVQLRSWLSLPRLPKFRNIERVFSIVRMPAATPEKTIPVDVRAWAN